MMIDLYAKYTETYQRLRPPNTLQPVHWNDLPPWLQAVWVEMAMEEEYEYKEVDGVLYASLRSKQMTTIEAIVRAAKMGREVRFIPCSDDMVRVEIERCESKWHFTHELVKYANVCEHIAGDSISRILDAVDK